MRRLALAVGLLFVVVALVPLAGGCVSVPYKSGLRPTYTAPADIQHVDERVKVSGGTQLLHQRWLPAAGEAKAVLLIVHGLKDYGDRYRSLAEMLVTKHAMAVHAVDLRGHGDSEGDRVWVDDFDEYVGDVEVIVRRVREQHPGKKVFLFGHSMGGAIALRHVLQKREAVDGFILSAPALELPVPGPVRGVARFMGTIFPTLALLELDDSKFSKDPQVVSAMKTDPLIFDGSGPARTARELFRAVSENSDQFEAVTVPFLIVHGEKDEVTSPSGSKALHDRARSTDKTLEIYPGMLHDLLHEPEREQVANDIAAWLDGHSGT